MTGFADAPPAPEIVPVEAGDGARFELMLVLPPDAPPGRALLWLPAMGVPARHYLPLAQGLAARGVAVAIHEWRGIGSSDRRAGRRMDWGYRELLEQDLVAASAALAARLPGLSWAIGGHSLGGQMACLFAALHPRQVHGLVLVASGAPYWRAFPHPVALRLAYYVAPLLASLRGHLPGRRLGFAGNEARGVIDDWARSGRSGRYAARGIVQDLETALAALHAPVLAVRLRDDWLVPAASLDWLLGKLPAAPVQRVELDASALDGQRADHFAWMKAPAAVADAIADWMR
ncbi:MAG TPA: alpha/beta fold hydrolase [Dyella sp.]|nr:alpha/beta fold hydrolase [Dyella sp.]